MKRITALLLAALCIFSAMSVCTADASKTGDVNGDGSINSEDAIYYLYGVFFPDDYPVFCRTDMNKDGFSDADDAIYLLYSVFFPEEYVLGSTSKAEKKYYAPEYSNYKTEYSGMNAKLKAWFLEKLESGQLFSANVDGKNAVCSVKPEITKISCGENERFTARYELEDGLTFTLIATVYGKYPAVDYVVYAENTGNGESGIISDFYAVNTEFPLAKNGNYILNTTKGSSASASDFENVSKTLTASEISFSPNNGRSSDGAWPYFDVIGDNCGIITAVGWTGKWKASFADTGNVKIKTSQCDLSTVLLPGESIRTPSAVLMYFDGDAEYGHNIWRKLMVDFYSPSHRDDGYFVAPWCLNFWGGRPESFISKTVQLFGNVKAKIDAVWLDAGWYGDFESEGEKVNTAKTTWSNELGWYTANTKLFPSGLKSLADKIHASGYKFMLWHMIEDTSIGYEKSLGAESYYPKSVYSSSSKLYLKLYDDAVYEKVLEFFDSEIKNDGVDWIRVDNWLGGINAWTENDKIISKEKFGTENKRKGYTENRHITNFYRLWDTLSEKYPDFALDNCASGGRRLDIEMAKRGVPLWRTDYDSGNNEAVQFQTQNLAKWIPFSAVGVLTKNEYHNRSLLSACGSLNAVNVTEADFVDYYNALEEAVTLRKYWYGCYYQIFTPTNDKSSWQAYELYREDLNAGFATVLRRPSSEKQKETIKLKGLDPSATYIVHDMAHGDYTEYDSIHRGSTLMNDGIEIKLGASSSVVLLLMKI